MVQVLVVAQQKRSAAHLRNDHIEVAIAVDIGERRTASHQRFEQVPAAFLRRDDNETAAAVLAGVPE